MTPHDLARVIARAFGDDYDTELYREWKMPRKYYLAAAEAVVEAQAKECICDGTGRIGNAMDEDDDRPCPGPGCMVGRKR